MDRAIVIVTAAIGLAAVAVAISLWEPLTEDSGPPPEAAPVVAPAAPSKAPPPPSAAREKPKLVPEDTGAPSESDEHRAQEYEEHLAAGRWGSPDVERALKDGSPAVRFRVLAQAASQGVTLPLDTLEELALRDVSANVRRLAVALLGTNPALESSRAERIAVEASNDRDEAVQGTAAEILEHLEARHVGGPTLEAPPYIRDAEEAIPR